VPKKKAVQKRKHVPQRTCVGCREVLPKRTLIRIVRTAEAVKIDPTGKMAGRGAYLHNQRSCWERGMKGVLAQALKVELTEEDKRILLAYMTSVPEDDPAQDEESNSRK
jgi:predicted RNA-binding protein YlxR (DUF448 family)